jgi:dihydrofolate reductase
MGKVISNISMSLDGFITGPNVRVGNGLGDDGDRLHDWMFDAKTETDAAIVDELYASTGAVLMGKGMFDVGFEPWGDVGIWGGANLIRQYLKAGLLDEMQVHLIPILLGGGVRLFENLDPEGIELRRASSIETPSATHLRFSVVR